MSDCCECAYLDDRFCVECGDELAKNSRVITDDGDVSEILSKLRSVYHSAKIITGVVESTFLYQRHYKKSGDHSRDETYSYWWVTIKTDKGKIVNYSVEAEDADVDSIKKGDLISFIVTKSTNLTYPLLNKRDRKIVRHDKLSATTVFHKNKNEVDSGFYTITDYLKPKKYSVINLVVIAFIISVGLFFAEIYFYKNYDLPSFSNEIIYILSEIIYVFTGNGFSGDNQSIEFWLIFVLFMSVVLNFFSYLMYWREEKIYEVLRASSKKILSAYSSISTFDNVTRPSNDSDVSCHSCNKFIDASADYCNYCGSSKKNGAELCGNTESKSRTDYINEKYRALFTSWNERYTYRHVMIPNEKGEVESDIYLAKVVKKNIGVSASKSRSSATYRTTI